jgi:hypothetical protein
MLLSNETDGGPAMEKETKPGITIVQPNEKTTMTNAGEEEDSGGWLIPSEIILLMPVLASTPVVHDRRISNLNLNLKTPISALLSSIQQGFDLTPCSPLSPARNYLNSSTPPFESAPFRLGVIKTGAPPVTQP